MEFEVRSSSVGKLCTNKPTFNSIELIQAETVVKNKIEKSGKIYNRDHLELYTTTKGIMTDAKKLKALFEKEQLFLLDPLPEGAMTYLEELWLQNHYGFKSFSLKEGNIATQKGTMVEDEAIALLSSYHNVKYVKNTIREKKGYLSGECDVHFNSMIRDMKCPETWETFRKKTGIPSIYYWQLVAYCHLYDCTLAALDYVIMPNPEDLIPLITYNFSHNEYNEFMEMEEKIKSMPARQRVKSYTFQGDLLTEISFMLGRIEKSKIYYESLTYEKCMKM